MDTKDIFDAYPDVKEIFVGKDGKNQEQAFFTFRHAMNFAGGKEDNVKAVKRSDKSDKSPAAEKAQDPAEKAPVNVSKKGQ